MAFQQGLSGLSTSAKALDVVSNNIANASTVGFKAGQAQFADVYAASLGVGGASQVGIGSNSAVVAQQFSQGNISSSNNPLDLAINGAGFFRMQKNPVDQTITYSRNGQFHLDDRGYIVNGQNLNLTGYPIVNTVVNRAQLIPVQLDTTGVTPRATGSSSTDPGIITQINLDDRETRSLTSPSPNTLAPWSSNTSMPPNNLNTFNYSTSVTVYDEKGNDHALSMYFVRVAPSDGLAPGKNLWETHFVLDSTDITDAVVAATSGQTVGVPTLEFSPRGGIVKSGFNNGGFVDNENRSPTGSASVVALPGTYAPGTFAVTVVDGNGDPVPASAYDISADDGTITFTEVLPTATATVTYSYDVVPTAPVGPTPVVVTPTYSTVLEAVPVSGSLRIQDQNTGAVLSSPDDYSITGNTITFAGLPPDTVITSYQTADDSMINPETVLGETLTITASTAQLANTPLTGSLTLYDSTVPTPVELVAGTDYNLLANGEIEFLIVPGNLPVTANYQYDDGSANAIDYMFNIDVTGSPIFSDPNSPFYQLFSNDIPLNFDNSTLFGSGYDVNKLVQDGYPYGRLSGVSVSPEGVLRGNYSNGQTKDIAQLVLVDFIAPTGLTNLGNNQWAETAQSGQPLIGDPGAGNRGLLQAASVEEANVDLTQELVNLITFQRNYQANAQSIKTQDQVLQTLVNLR